MCAQNVSEHSLDVLPPNRSRVLHELAVNERDIRPKSEFFRSAYDSERPMLISDSIDASKCIICCVVLRIRTIAISKSCCTPHA